MRRATCLVIAAAAALGSAAPPPVGTISGRVTYAGPLPEPVYVFESGTAQALLAVDGTGGLAGAVVSVDAALEPIPPDAPEVVVRQRNWWFMPAVVAVRAGQPVRFTNEDSSNHSVRSAAGVPANRFGAYTGTGEPYVHRFRANPDGSPSVLTCDIHAWMMAWVYAFDHRHFRQTDGTGRFTLRDLPPRRYRLVVRYGPAGFARELDVNVAAGAASRVDVGFGPSDLKVPPR